MMEFLVVFFTVLISALLGIAGVDAFLSARDRRRQASAQESNVEIWSEWVKRTSSPGTPPSDWDKFEDRDQ
jgi:hypothetical protein